MKYFGLIDKNVVTIFQLQWKIGNIADTFLQYSVLCEIALSFFISKYKKPVTEFAISFHPFRPFDYVLSPSVRLDYLDLCLQKGFLLIFRV